MRGDEWVGLQWAPHALERARERFPGVDLEDALRRSGRAGKKRWRRIREQCPVSARTYMARGRQFFGRYYRIGPGDIVFVIAPPGVIVTVFPLQPKVSDET